MPRIRLIRTTAAAALLAAAACADATGPELGRITGTLDGRPWSAGAQAFISGDTVTIWAQGQDPQAGRQQDLVLRAVPEGGGYRLVPGRSGFSTSVGGDVDVRSADVVSGTLSITRLDDDEVAGRASFVAEGELGTVTLTDGAFRARRVTQ